MTPDEVHAVLNDLGWQVARHRGTSHKQYKHPEYEKLITIVQNLKHVPDYQIEGAIEIIRGE